MATCSFCGSQIPEGAKFCTECGATVPAGEQGAPSFEQTIANATVQQPNQQPDFGQPDVQQPYSGSYQQSGAQQPHQQQTGYQQPYSQPVYTGPVQQPVNDSGSIGWGVLGFFFPIVGLVLFLVWKNTKPKCAKVAGIGAIIGFCLGLVANVIPMMMYH